MLLCYALGGGVGHLVRTRAVLRALSIREDVIVLASSPYVRDPRVAEGLRIVCPPAVEAGGAAYRTWLADRVDEWRPQRILVDAFPCGLFGEIAAIAPGHVRLLHVARALRWAQYLEATGGQLPRFDVTYVVEPLPPEQRRALRGCSRTLKSLTLETPAQAAPAVPLPDPFWLVAHSGPREEVSALVAYACETRLVEGLDVAIVVASLDDPGPLPDGCHWLSMFPVVPLFARADRLFTAAGFNVMREAAPWRERHRILPFPRRFDDQFARARELRATSDERRTRSDER